MRTFLPFPFATWAVILMAGVGGMAGAAEREQPGSAPSLSSSERLERFHNKTPAERLRLIQTLPRNEAEFHKVTRGDLIVAIVERGVLEPVAARDLVCRVKGTLKSTTATTVKSIIDEGTFVKQGQVIAQLDNSEIEEKIKEQKITNDQAQARKVTAAENLKITQNGIKLDRLAGEINLKAAELELKKAAADDDLRKLMELKVQQAQMNLEQFQSQAKVKIVFAEADLRSMAAIADQEAGRLRDLQEQLRHCTLAAPCDGLVLYPENDRARSLVGRNKVVAQGEPVSEGQCLLRVCDLKHMQVITAIHEALLARVRIGQKALVCIDAFPEKQLTGEVTKVAAIASPQDYLTRDVKLFPTTVTLKDELPGWRPGMTAEVRIVQGERANVIQTPVRALVRGQEGWVCYRKTGDGLEECPVLLGPRGNLTVEIKEGLKEGDLILRDPRTLLRRLDQRDKAPLQPQGEAPAKEPQILLRSVLTPDVSMQKRTRVLTYGLTYDDLKQVGLIAGVAGVIPLRFFPKEIRQRERMSLGRIVGTTPVFFEEMGLNLAPGLR